MQADSDIVRRSLGEPHAFGELFDRHFDRVHAFAQRRVGADLADEVTAEAFTRAFDRRRRYDLDRPDALPWLLGITSNLLRRHWRTERRRLDAYARSLPTADPPAEEGRELLDAVARLPRAQREAVLLYAWGELSYEEIAQAVDVPVGTVRSRLAAARRRLRPAVRVQSPRFAKEAADA